MAKTKPSSTGRRPGRPKTAGDNSAPLHHVPDEPTEWPEGRPFRFHRCLEGDPDRPGKWTTRQVYSRSQLEDLVLAEGLRSAWHTVRACRLAERFEARERTLRPGPARELSSALHIFLPLLGERPIGSLVETDMAAVRTAMEARLRPRTSYSYMLRLRAMMDYAVEHGFTDEDAIGMQVVRFVPAPSSRVVQDPLLFEPFRRAADIEQCVIFDLACGHGALVRQVIDLVWTDVDLVTGKVYLQPVTEERQQDTFGDWVQLAPRELLAFVRLRIRRIKQDRLGDWRVYEHWTTVSGVRAAVRFIQFKCLRTEQALVTSAPSAARDDGVTSRGGGRAVPATWRGAYDYVDFRYAAGRREAEAGSDARTVGRAASLSHFPSIMRIFGPYIRQPLEDACHVVGETAVLRSLLGTGGTNARQL